MKELTIDSALHALDCELDAMKSCYYGNYAQVTYYRGMYRMLELIVSEGYSTQVKLNIGEDGKHEVVYANGRTVMAN